MLLNHFKIAFRYLLKNKVFTAINIFGLTLGFLCFGLLGLYVHDELSFDAFHQDADRIYRVIQHELNEAGEIRHVSAVAAQIGPQAKTQFPEIEDVLRVYSSGRVTVGNDPAQRNYVRIFTADSNFFDFFDYQLIEGNEKTALTQPNSLVLTEAAQEKYFGSEKALGKTLLVSGINMEVTGIMKNPPKNSNLDIQIVYSHKTWLAYFDWMPAWEASDWQSNGFATYIKLRPDADLTAMESRITKLVEANYGTSKAFTSTFSLQQLRNIHTGSTDITGNEQFSRPGINPFYIQMFIGIAFLILLIACLNFMNLSTAAALKRTREIGTRKSLGALKTQLIIQFTTEAILLSAFAMVFAIAFIQLLLPLVNNITDKDLQLITLEPKWIATGILTMLLAGALSSLYPAFIISRISPTAAMKKDVRVGSQAFPVRKMLIVAQFAITFIMIASTLVIYKQVSFMRSKELGIDVSDVVVVDINSKILRRDFETIKTEFARIPQVEEVSVSSRVPGEWKDFPIVPARSNDITADHIFVGVDKDFLSTYNVQLLQGRNFTEQPSDSSKVILSSLAVEALGLKDPIGAIIEIPSARFAAEVETLDAVFRVEVVGVVDNFHFESMKVKMMPMILGYWNNPIQSIDYYSLKVNTTDWPKLIAELQAVNNKFDTENPLEYTFLGSRFEKFYEADTLRGQIFLSFSVIIVFIASLGLFALVSYAVETRTKEIGIRKVLGASVSSIVSMVSKDFLVLIVIASAIAIPVTVVFMQRWLEDFAYHITLGAGVFLGAALITLLVAGITIGIRSLKAASANPVTSLRSE